MLVRIIYIMMVDGIWILHSFSLYLLLFGVQRLDWSLIATFLGPHNKRSQTHIPRLQHVSTSRLSPVIDNNPTNKVPLQSYKLSAVGICRYTLHLLQVVTSTVPY